jgi:type IV secretion system protein VirB9
MRSLLVLLGICLIVGCAKEEPPPPVPPPPEDLSTWAVPELVQPPPPESVPEGVPTAEDKPTGAEKVSPYTPGTVFAVQVALTSPLDLVLERGEHVRNIVSGDRAPSEPGPVLAQGEVRANVPSEAPAPTQGKRWEIKEGASGLGDSLRSHVFITASEAGLSTGVIITTTKRTYLLDLKSVRTSPIRVVRWTYPQEAAVQPRKAREPGVLPDPLEPRHYHVGYAIASHGHTPDWQPRQVADDGTKTYLILPEVALFGTAPMIRLLGVNGPQLVNARAFLNVIILDVLLTRAELRVGVGEHAEVVTVTRGQLKTIACPESPECPVWPQAAQSLARKGRGPTAPSVHAVTEGGQP